MKKCLEKNFGTISKDTIEVISKIAQSMYTPKNEIILKYGDFCKNIWFIEQGAVKAYEIYEGEFRTIHFFTEHSFFTNYNSLLTKKSSEIEFKCVENCSILKININELENLYSKHHELEHIGRKIAELQYIAEHNLRRLFLNMNAKQRYEYIETTEPDIIKRFSQKDVASFIGITKVSLSRLRAQRGKLKN
jgi:CRP-like cAMP-binding protein